MIVDRENFGNTKGHYINWYVHRDNSIRNAMSRLWNGGSGIEDKETMQGASIEQRICKAVNVLFRNMETYGPSRNEYKRFKYDRKNDFYHAHVWEAGITYVVMWEVDEKEKIINIVKMDKHENFNFKRHKKHKKEDAIDEINKFRNLDRKYQQYLHFDRNRSLRRGA